MKIEELISKEALASFDLLYEKLIKNIAAFEQVVKNSVELNKTLGGATSFKEASTSIEKLAKAELDLAAKQKENIELNQKLTATLKVKSEAQKNIDKATVAEQVTRQKGNAQLRAEIQLEQAAQNSIQEATAAISVLRKERDKLDLTTKAGVTRQAELNKAINQYNLFITANTDKDVKRTRNIGNYSQAVKTLEAQLAKLIEKETKYRAEGNASEEMLSALNKEQKLLTTFLERQEQGFASASQEIKTNTTQLQQLALAGLESSDAYKQLASATAQLVDDTGDLKTALKNSAPDDVAFNAAADAARGLVGVYGLAKSGAAVLGIENEALEETMVKLQAAETALQSIEAVRALFKKENAFRQAINIGLQKVEIFQTNLEGAAQKKNIIIRYAAIAAQKVLNAVMAISAPQLLLIIGVLALAVTLFSSFSTEVKESAVNLENFNIKLDQGIELLDSYNDSVAKSGQEKIAKLQAEFKSEKEIREAGTEILRKQLSETRTLLTIQRKEFQQAEAERDKLVSNLKRGSLTESETKRLQELTETIKKGGELRKRENDLASQIEIDYQNSRKASTEELAEQNQKQLDILKVGLTTRSEAYAAIAADEKNSYDKRIDAQKKFNDIQQSLITNDLTKEQADPSLRSDPLRAALIQRQANAAREKAKKEGDKAIDNLNREQIDKERRLQVELYKLVTEEATKGQEAIADNETKSYDERLTAAYNAFQNRVGLLKVERDLAITNAIESGADVRAIETQYAIDSNAEVQAYSQKQLEILKIAQEQQTALIEQEQAKRQNLISGQGGAATAALNQQFAAGLIGITAYNKAREKIERETNLRLLQEDVNNATAKLMRTKAGTAERIAAEKEYYDAINAFQDEQLAKQKSDAQKLQDVRIAAIQEGAAAFEAAILGTYDKEKNVIQGQIDALETKKQKDIEVANSTIADEEKKAAAIKVIEARAAAEREQLEIRKRRVDYEKARTERAITIGKIVAETARAVVEALPNYPLAIATGLLGAAQLARVLATPLPQFAEGTMDAPGGNVIVGDGYRKEMVITPGGKLIETPAVPTVMNVEKHSIILPDSRKFMEHAVGASKPARLSSKEDYMNAMLAKKLDNLNRTMKGSKVKQEPKADFHSFMLTHKYGNNWWNWIDDQIHI